MKLQSTKVYLLLIQQFICLCTLFWGVQAGFAESEEADIYLVSPIAAVARSIVITGVGPVLHTRLPTRQCVFCRDRRPANRSLAAHKSFRNIYDNDYVPAASKKRDSPEALSPL